MTPASGSARSDEAPRPAPGRPKDLNKRAAILEAAKRLFLRHGVDGVSMDQIAGEAGVSKLTVYSHYGDKESLFVAAVRAHCDQQLPDALFDASPETPLPDRLLVIARAFFGMVSTPEAIAGHRIMCAPQVTESALPQMFWDAGPRRIQESFAGLLQRRQALGQLDVPDPERAASQFFNLVKGDAHALLVFGCGACAAPESVEAHLQASVDMFLRAYAPRPS
ncbi:MAG TPA: TetR/AcrR family transcriptional regulator [Luteimonas sp.]|nr:TetR/AcrR family transcriptional regulator [Luteimonas sp.]